jgi:hypothetical protein
MLYAIIMLYGLFAGFFFLCAKEFHGQSVHIERLTEQNYHQNQCIGYLLEIVQRIGTEEQLNGPDDAAADEPRAPDKRHLH